EVAHDLTLTAVAGGHSLPRSLPASWSFVPAFGCGRSTPMTPLAARRLVTANQPQPDPKRTGPLPHGPSTDKEYPMASSRSWPFEAEDRPSGSVRPPSQADLQAILAHLATDDPDELLAGTGADR